MKLRLVKVSSWPVATLSVPFAAAPCFLRLQVRRSADAEGSTRHDRGRFETGRIAGRRRDGPLWRSATRPFIKRIGAVPPHRERSATLSTQSRHRKRRMGVRKEVVRHGVRESHLPSAFSSRLSGRVEVEHRMQIAHDDGDETAGQAFDQALEVGLGVTA